MSATKAPARARSTKKVADDGLNIDEVNVPVEAEAPKARKYFSHSNCDHARKGEEGKAARAACRRSYHAWFNAEAEYLAGEGIAVAV